MLGILSSLLPNRYPVSECRGDGRYAVIGAGGEQHQQAFARICGEKGAVDHPVTVLLIPGDSEDVFRLKIRGRTVGCLGRTEGRRLRSHLKKLGYGTCIVKVAGRIRGGAVRKRGGAKPYFVALDLPGFIAGGRA